MHRNILSVYQFFLHNHVNIKFSSSSFYVKDPKSGVTLLHGPCHNGVYEWTSTSSSKLVAYAHSTPVDRQHRLGHPTTIFSNKILSTFTSVGLRSTHCTSCLINKTHNLPFGTRSLSSLSSFAPLELLYTDV